MVSKKPNSPATTGIKGDEAKRAAQQGYWTPTPEQDRQIATTGIYGDEARRQAYANQNNTNKQLLATTGIKGDAARKAAQQFDQYGRPLRRSGVSSRRNR